MVAVPTVEAIAAVGLAGDRYAERRGTFSPTRSMSVRDVSIVALETVRALSEASGRSLAPGDLRRNLVTEGLELGELVGARLAIGEVLLEVTSTCPPCGHLDRLLGFDARPHLRRRGGLRARIEVGGLLQAGTPIEIRATGRTLP
ncbi:MAG: MOSC domain-containing protein [Planctomycetota bacterium]